MGYKQKNEIRTPFKDAWEGKEKGKIVPYFTNGNEKKRNLKVVQSYGIYWGQTKFMLESLFSP